MNYRGVVNSTYQLARYSKKLLKYKPIIFYDSKNKANKGDVIKSLRKNLKHLVYQISQILKILKKI